MYFDAAPEEVENIARLSSTRPNAKEWAEWIESENISALYKVSGPLGEYMRTSFDGVCISEVDFGRCRSEWSDNHKYVAVDEVDVALKILMLGGKRFTAIELLDFDVGHSFGYNTLNTLFERCPNLESFDFFSKDQMAQAARWVEVFGKRMKTLIMDGYVGPQILSSISMYCTDIRKLELASAECGVLSGLSVWENVGNALETLKMTIDSSGEEELRKIEKYCRNLKSIDIQGDSVSSAALSECLVSYEGQLEYAVVSDMRLEELEVVAVRCVNADFYLVYKGGGLSKYLSSIGPRLQKVTFYNYPGYDGDPSVLRYGWDLCHKLAEITVVNQLLSVPALRGIFNTPKLHLRKIDMDFVDFKVLDVLAARRVTTLESAKFWCEFPPRYAFNALVANNTSLRHVEIHIFGDPPENVGDNILLERVGEVISCFLGSSQLQVLEVDDNDGNQFPGVDSPGYFDTIREMLRTAYRHRRVDIRLFGKQLA